MIAQRAWRLAALAVVLVGVWSLAGWLISAGGGQPVADQFIFDRVQAATGDVMVTAARIVTLGGDPYLAPVAVAGLAAFIWFRTRSWEFLVMATVALGGSAVVASTVKLIVDRPRPDDGLVETMTSAFPSGHSVRGVVVFGLLAWWVATATRWAWRRVLAAVCVILAGGVVVSRVMLGVHWPSDVLAGAVLGVVWLAATLQWGRPRATDLRDG